MRLDKREHERSPWRVRSLAADFELLDVWEYPIVADASAGEDFALFCRLMDADAGKTDGPPVGGLAGFLFRVRGWLGKVFNLDAAIELPIPGCRETSLRERLPAPERVSSAAAGPMGFRDVYRRDDELLMELSNKTVHALMHIGWVHKEGSRYAPQLAVYAKWRGALGRYYMALISPFRHYVVYPALMRSVRRKWEALRTDRSGT